MSSCNWTTAACMALVWCFAAMSMQYHITKQSSSSSVPWVLGWEVKGSLFKTRSGQNTVFWWGGQVPEQHNAKVLLMKEPYTQLLSEGWQQQLNVLPFPVFVALCICAHIPLGKQMLPLPSLFLNTTRLASFYHCSIESMLAYCICVWFNSSPKEGPQGVNTADWFELLPSGRWYRSIKDKPTKEQILPNRG